MGLAQTGQAIFPVEQVIERAQQQDRVDGGVCVRQAASVAHLGGGELMFRLLRTRRPRLLYMPGDGVDQMDSISERGQPAGVDAVRNLLFAGACTTRSSGGTTT